MTDKTKPATEPDGTPEPAQKSDEQTTGGTGQPATGGSKPTKPNPVRVLYSMFATAHELVHADGRAYAVPRWLEQEGRRGRSPLLGPVGVAKPLGAELRRQLVRVARLGIPAGADGGMVRLMLGQADADKVLLQLEADAFDGAETPLALRFHYQPDHESESDDVIGPSIVLDLGDDTGRVVVIDAGAWSVDASPPELGTGPVVFRRSHATKPLPTPELGGRLEELAPLLGLDPAGQEFAVLLGWVLGLAFDDTRGTVRPGLLLTGPPGSGKSTRARLAVSLLEPSGTAALGSSFGRNVDDDKVRALHRAVPIWDNLSGVSQAVSDSLCSLVTGSARETRALYTDNELNAVPVRRPVVLTAVGVPAGLRPDALDRLVHIELDPLAQRLPDSELQARFDRAHPRMLGALCSALSAALDYQRMVRPPTEYRMAGHAHTLAALDAALGDGDPRVAGLLPSSSLGLLAAYDAAVRQVKERTAVEDVFGGAVVSLLEHHGGEWQGKASELVAAAGVYAPLGDRVAGWPSARGVPVTLNQLRDGLALAGVTWTTTTVRGSTRYILRGGALTGSAGGSPGGGLLLGQAHPLEEKPTPKPTPFAPGLTCEDAERGGRGGLGGRDPAYLSVPKVEEEREEVEEAQMRRRTPTTPTTPTPGQADTWAEGAARLPTAKPSTLAPAPNPVVCTCGVPPSVGALPHAPDCQAVA